jgi:hypothetical protein
MDAYLYRGVSARFHRDNGGLLKPKVTGAFTYNFHWGEAGAIWGGITWGSSLHNATSGISTTPHIERATVYARGKDGRSEGYVYKIDRPKLHQHGIQEFIVAHYCKPSIPEDDEVILVAPEGLHLPPDLVIEMIPVAAVLA